jgi:lipopolysaccharide/colanic/teichoic acid biosynthesis glycosyltransferase
MRNPNTDTKMGNSDLKIAIGEVRPPQRSSRHAVSRMGAVPPRREEILKEEAFHAMLTLERRRAERSRKPFVLMLLDSRAVHKNGKGTTFTEQLLTVVCDATRETDLIGWYEEGAVLAVIFTEISLEGKNPITEILHSKVVAALRDNLDHKIAAKLSITVHLFPESWDTQRPDRTADIKLYPDLSRKGGKKRLTLIAKRAIDIVGSLGLLLVLSPILAVIALAIKLTSKGPVIFRQERLGQFGKSFKCLKFRTMSTNNDPKIHREFVHRFIAGRVGNPGKQETESVVYKITNDPRITAVGGFLRKTSLDEFPQFWNVLCGEMSLVGPRPPVAYEFEVYDFWHRRRVLEVKPGVTGLWQVSGRSRTCFDDMVRLDLRYSQSWSLWLDLKILIATPRAVFTSEGAY